MNGISLYKNKPKTHVIIASDHTRKLLTAIKLVKLFILQALGKDVILVTYHKRHATS